MPKSINKILIANRGEIAIRVMRTCREMGISTVAVFSDADRHAPHVKMADEAYHIGASPARESYLKGDTIIATALKSKADAIHPGYGFLSENADFARDVATAGLIFIGPPPEVIHSMGSKTEARQMMEKAGVPVVPGDKSGINTAEESLQSALKIGLPVLLKSAMGGGGKGMRVVLDADDLSAAFEAARREAKAAFNDDEIYLEKYITLSRHVEVQILADQHGKCIHLYERECSIQRRHQKVIEEAPAPALAGQSELREKMSDIAVKAGLACGYIGAGTVEMLYDPKSSNFYFLEMNTRLQVEHPITELVTGFDLVREQIKIARGEHISINQHKVKHRGHAIECRIYAEDTEAGFLPDAGTVENLAEPSGPGVRLDSGVEMGSEVGTYYDPMVAKLAVWDVDRPSAIAKMRRALCEYRISGFKTTIPFARWVMENERFVSGEYDTAFVENEYYARKETQLDAELTKATLIAAALFQHNVSNSSGVGDPAKANHELSNWKQSGKIQGMN
jgi:acetyl-CoA carboxylase biotin carboxylase subunit